MGAGLSGVAMAETLLGEGQKVTVFDDASQKASMVAGGLYNPVVLKQFNLVWEGKRLMEVALPFYRSLEDKLDGHFDDKLQVLRRFATVEEQNKWFEAADQPGLSDFLSLKLLSNTNQGVDAPFGFGEVLSSGRIQTARLLNSYRKYLEGTGSFRKEGFDYGEIALGEDGVSYQGFPVDGIIFAEGYGLRANPFFNYLPLQGTKGELLEIHAPGLKEQRVLKAGIFLIPLGGDRYLAGATYARRDHSPEPTDAAREELLRGLRKLIRCDFEVTGQRAGIRPTVPDRRPLVGGHPKYAGLYVINGMGSRGVLIAPYTARCLADRILHGHPLPESMDCARFSRRFFKFENPS